jgi:signal transduction histidine kinase
LTRHSHTVRILVWVAAFAALIPLARLVTDWVEVSRMLAGSSVEVSGRGFDWVQWQEDDGVIYASYVLQHGPAYEGGIRDGDVFFMLEYQQYFNADDLKSAIEGIEPGATRSYFVQRGGEFIEAEVHFTRYPTFLYPLSATLWHFSVWGFLVAAFIHVIGLIIVGPLAMRSRKAQHSLLLILTSSLWIFSNLLRLLTVEFAGPPLETGDTYDHFFQTLTVVGLIGWIGFPALLVHKVVRDTFAERGMRIGLSRIVIYLPPAILGLAALLTSLRVDLGPISIDGLVAPILFYACCYLAAAAILMLIPTGVRKESYEGSSATWNRMGSAVMLVLSLLFGLSVLGIVPIFGVVTETIAGWLIVSAELLSVAPVVLVSHATLKHGKVDQVLSRGLAYVTISGVIFFAFVGGLSIIEPYFERLEVSRNVVAGLLGVVLLFIVEWLVRQFRGYGMSILTTDRRRMYHSVQQFQEQMRSILDYEELVQRTVEMVGKAFGTRSAVIFLRPLSANGPRFTGSYHPEPPYLTERMVSKVWQHLSETGRIWSSNPELNEISLPEQVHSLLTERGVALLVPIVGKDEPIGIIALGRKKHRRFVYNLEEIEVLRSLSGQLALAVERLKLVEREKTLVRESAEAQLVALRAQINPHFLFNSLNTIVSLIEERPDEAEEVVEHLAAIFRYILQIGSRPFVAMEDEFELITHYLSIERSRFGSSLKVEQHLDPCVRRLAVPAFAVQTLVENAVKHGLANRRGGGTLCIDCRRGSDGMGEVVVSDTGVGIAQLFDLTGGVADAQSFFGIGLKNVSARLEQLYGRGDLLHLFSAPGEGTTATLRLPDNQHAYDGGVTAAPDVHELNGKSESEELHSASHPSPPSTNPHAERQASA